MGKKKLRGKQQEEETADATTGAPVSSSRRKSKKDRLADPFFDEELPTEPTDASSLTEEIEEGATTHHAKPKKKNKREKGPKHKMNMEEDSEEDEDVNEGNPKAGNLFSALDAAEEASSESEEETPLSKPKASNTFASLMDGDEEDEEDEGMLAKKTSERKKESNAFASAFAALEQETEDENGAEKDISDAKAAASNAFAALEEEEDDVPNDRVSKKKSKKKKTSKAFDSAFAALEDEESGNLNADEQETTPVDASHIKKPGANAFASLMDEEDEEEKEETVSKKKSKKKKASAAFDSAFAALEEEGDVSKETEVQPATKGKKSKGKKGGVDFDALMDTMVDEQNASKLEENEPAESSSEILAAQEDDVPVTETQPKENIGLSAKEKKKGKKKKKGTKAQQETEDIDALLAEIEGKGESTRSPEESIAVESVPETHPAEEKAEELATETPVEKTLTVEQKDATEECIAPEKATEIEIAADDGAEATVDVENEVGDGEDEAKEVKLTAAQKKKLRKKEKKAKEKEKEAHKSEKAAKAKEEKTPAHVRKIQEQLEKKRLEEEKRRLEEEAEKARIAEEERLKQEAEQQKEEEARKKAEAKAKKEELKKKGHLLTKKQKAEQARMAVVSEQLLKNAGISRTTSGSDRPMLTPQEQKRIQREREEEKRRIAAEKRKEEEEQLQKEEAEKKRQEALLAEQKRQEEEERKRQEEEDAIADNWEDISETEEPEVAAEEEAVEETASEDASESENASESGSESTTDLDSDSDASSSYSEDSEEMRERQIDEARKKVEARIEEAKAAASADHLRSPICCILGHVDTGKTKILDNIRRTNVQDNEAGGITQQIGATYIPSESLQTRTADLRKGREYDMKVPGLLVIDTPGHESFTNLRTRGSSLCDIAILVVDLMHGLEAQTVESIELLRQKKTPFIIALNKVDRLNDWKVVENAPIRETLNRQKKHTMLHFEDQLQACTTMLMERGLNVSLYWKNKEPRRIVNMVPTSAITGEGIPDMLQLLIKLTTSLMAEKLMFLSEIQCSVLEVKAVEGLGTTIDVVLVNGKLSEGDKIVVCGMTGPIVTTIRSLLTPHPLKELRVKGSYLHHKTIQAAQGIKLCAQNLEHAVAGTALRVVRNDDEEECKLLAQEEMEEVMSRIDKSGEGVSVQASTLGSLEALLEFLKTPEVRIPVSAIAIGPVHKKDVMRANVMNEKKLKKFAVVLAFDVPVTREAREMAEELNVKIFTADIIYHLFDQFKAYVEDVRQSEKRAASADAVFPCILSILPTCIFNKKDPIILGCEVREGQARVGTPLVVPAKPNQGMVSLGRIESMELNHKSVQKAQRGDNVAVKIQSTCPDEASKLYGRHFDHQDQLVSHISRDSINALKAFFKDEMSTDDWNLVIKLKKVFQVE